MAARAAISQSIITYCLIIQQDHLIVQAAQAVPEACADDSLFLGSAASEKLPEFVRMHIMPGNFCHTHLPSSSRPETLRFYVCCQLNNM